MKEPTDLHLDLIAEGDKLFAQGDNAGAEAAYREAIRANPGHSAAHSGLGLVLVDQEKPAEAGAAFREAIGCDPGNPDAHRGLGCVLWEAQRYAEAEEAFRAAITLDPSDTWTRDNLGRLLDEAAQHQPGPIRRWRGLRLAWSRTPPDAATLLTYPRASARHRFFAGAFDYGPWVALVFLFGPATVLTDPSTISMVLVYLLFNGLLEGISGQSIGKVLFGLYTIRPGTGEFMGGGTGIYRRILHVLDTVPAGAGWLCGLITGRTFADRIVGAVVVRRPQPSSQPAESPTSA